MRKLKWIMSAMVVTIPLLALALGAQAKGESQAGGLPALEDRVDALQSTLNSDITNLQNQINILDASTAFVSMNGDGSVNYSKDVDASNPLLTGRTGTGAYQVLFTRDVTRQRIPVRAWNFVASHWIAAGSPR